MRTTPLVVLFLGQPVKSAKGPRVRVSFRVKIFRKCPKLDAKLSPTLNRMIRAGKLPQYLTLPLIIDSYFCPNLHTVSKKKTCPID